MVNGFLLCEIVRIVMSRSVIVPIGFFVSGPSTTGMLPQSNSAIIFATSTRVVVSKQCAGFFVITSLIFIAYILLFFNKAVFKSYAAPPRSMKNSSQKEERDAVPHAPLPLSVYYY